MKSLFINDISQYQKGRDMALRYFMKLVAGFIEYDKYQYNYYKQFLKSDELKIVSKIQKEKSV